MNLKNKRFFGIVIIGIILFGGFYYTYPDLSFYEKCEITDEDFIIDILSDFNIEKIKSLNIAKSKDEKFMAISGTLIKNEELKYIVVLYKLPFVDYYHLSFDNIYRGEVGETGEYIMKITDDIIKTPLWKYNLLVDTDIILVTSRINTHFIAGFVILTLASILGEKIRKKSI